MRLIDKDAVVAQANIDISNCRIAAQQGILTEFGKGELEALEGIVDFLNTLEVKEVDLEKEFNSWYYHLNIPENYNIPQIVMLRDIIEKTAKHFFELGLKGTLKGE